MFHMIHIDIPLNRCACWLHHHVLQATFTYIPMIPNVIQSQWKKKLAFSCFNHQSIPVHPMSLSTRLSQVITQLN